MAANRWSIDPNGVQSGVSAKASAEVATHRTLLSSAIMSDKVSP